MVIIHRMAYNTSAQSTIEFLWLFSNCKKIRVLTFGSAAQARRQTPFYGMIQVLIIIIEEMSKTSDWIRLTEVKFG